MSVIKEMRSFVSREQSIKHFHAGILPQVRNRSGQQMRILLKLTSCAKFAALVDVDERTDPSIVASMPTKHPLMPGG